MVQVVSCFFFWLALLVGSRYQFFGLFFGVAWPDAPPYRSLISFNEISLLYFFTHRLPFQKHLPSKMTHRTPCTLQGNYVIYPTLGKGNFNFKCAQRRGGWFHHTIAYRATPQPLRVWAARLWLCR